MAFLEYLTELYEREIIEQVRVAGPETTAFTDRAPFPVIAHEDSDAATLDLALADGWPVLVMGNTVAEFMRDLEAEIENRAQAERDNAPDDADEIPSAQAQ
jgi:hypothetical protein